MPDTHFKSIILAAIFLNSLDNSWAWDPNFIE